MQPFSILLGLGTLLGLFMVGWRAPQKEQIRYVDAGVLVLFGALVGSRVGAVIINLNYYQAHAGEIFQIWLGGLSGIGALVGGILSIMLAAILWKFPIGALADTLLPLGGTLAVTAWLGCWLDRCAYGFPSGKWWAVPARDEWGVLADRAPVQIIGAILTLALVWLLERVSKRLPVRGLGAAIGLFGLAVILFGLSYLRADPTQFWSGLRLDAWGALILMGFSSLIVVVLLLRLKLNKNKVPHDRS